MASTVQEWPAHSYEERPWQQTVRAGRREDRMLKEVEVAVPPAIASLPVVLSPTIVADINQATAEIVRLDQEGRHSLAGLAAFLVRTDSLASSKIEHIDATPVDLAKAMLGTRASKSAQLTLNAVRATMELIDSTSTSKDTSRISLDHIEQAHTILLRDDPHEATYAGILRPMQNWIGGSDYSPRNALYVPPPPELVPELMRDLIAFANRDDIPAVVQAGIVHAQFESIHPFTDGNGRVGRALINTVLRRRGLTTTTVVPIAAALLVDVDEYFRQLHAYVEGSIDEFCEYFAQATRVACQASQESVAELAGLSEQWQEEINPRKGSTVSALLPLLVATPVVDADLVAKLTDAHVDSAYGAIGQLEEAGILHEITGRKRERIWVAHEVMEELDRLLERARSQG